MFQAKIILIAGPTATGKSALALDLARRTDSVIINADAMQVYQGLPILSAQPDIVARKEVPHELYGILDPAQRSSAGKWLELARQAINRAYAAKLTPILVGGTGLYFKSLLGGLADIPTVPEEVRKKAEALYDELGEEKFRSALARLDPVTAAKLAKNDRQRSIRAYEVALHTDKPLSEWQKNKAPAIEVESTEKFLLTLPREKLYASCDARFTRMIENGAVEEVRQFMRRGLDESLPAMKTLGLREIAAHLRGEISLDEAIAKAQQATRNYAKRQMTWFRNQWN